MIRRTTHVFLLCAAVFLPVPAFSQSWMVDPFDRPATTPVITPDGNRTFRDPLSQQVVHWEAAHTFNPAAVLEGNKVAVLYRAEDDTGREAIGGHTSRLGLAES